MRQFSNFRSPKQANLSGRLFGEVGQKAIDAQQDGNLNDPKNVPYLNS